jgi:putative transposase
MWYPSVLTPSQKEERRLEGGRLLCEGRLTHAQIAARLGVTTQAVGQWAKALGPDPGGLGVLRGRRPTGRPPLLTPEQWEEVLGTLAQGALDAGFETERWTLRRIGQVILKQFGVDSHPNYLAERLKASGWTAQVPAVQARERDEELVRAWLERDWPRIKKKRGARVRRSSLSTRPGSPSGRGRGAHGPRQARPPSCDGPANVARSPRRSDSRCRDGSTSGISTTRYTGQIWSSSWPTCGASWPVR